MNTKQLWTALILNKDTNLKFDGIYSIDTLSEIKNKPELIICNTDPSYLPGKHWVLFFFENNCVDFYDSLGKDITEYGPEFIVFIKKFSNNFKQCIGRTQPYRSSLCGLYCLYYAHNKCIGKSMDEIVNSMNVSTHVIDYVKDNFFINNNSCSFLHKCSVL